MHGLALEGESVVDITGKFLPLFFTGDIHSTIIKILKTIHDRVVIHVILSSDGADFGSIIIRVTVSVRFFLYTYEFIGLRAV